MEVGTLLSAQEIMTVHQGNCEESFLEILVNSVKRTLSPVKYGDAINKEYVGGGISSIHTHPIADMQPP